jgi:hypothetical protein
MKRTARKRRKNRAIEVTQKQGINHRIYCYRNKNHTRETTTRNVEHSVKLKKNFFFNSLL